MGGKRAAWKLSHDPVVVWHCHVITRLGTSIQLLGLHLGLPIGHLDGCSHVYPVGRVSACISNVSFLFSPNNSSSIVLGTVNSTRVAVDLFLGAWDGSLTKFGVARS